MSSVFVTAFLVMNGICTGFQLYAALALRPVLLFLRWNQRHASPIGQHSPLFDLRHRWSSCYARAWTLGWLARAPGFGLRHIPLVHPVILTVLVIGVFGVAPPLTASSPRGLHRSSLRDLVF